MAKTHQKHTHLERPNSGHFGQNEWAIIGTPCTEIKKIVDELTPQLSSQFKIAYVDADHHVEDTEASFYNMQYTDKITHHRFDTKETMGKFQFFPHFRDQDLLFINGNHFMGQQQIVVIDPEKEISLSKKLDRLTDVQMIILQNSDAEIYPFLTKHLRGVTIPVFSIHETTKIASFINQKMIADQPPVYGLVLAGGKSTRMGEDKGLIDYNGKPQREYAADLLVPYCEETFISCRAEQVDFIETNHSLLPDTFLDLGPYGGLLSAFRKHPNVAWMVVACDLPLLDEDTLAFLHENRNVSKVATCFKSNHNDFPEPLITIWEPRSYLSLLSFLAQGYSCPRKVLINTDVELLPTPDGDRLRNVNTQKERGKWSGK